MPHQPIFHTCLVENMASVIFPSRDATRRVKNNRIQKTSLAFKVMGPVSRLQVYERVY